ncbi:GCP2-like protein, partial [Mya arenaria]
INVVFQRLGHTTEVQMNDLLGDSGSRDRSRTTEKHKQKAKVLSEHVDDLVRNENFERTIGNFDSNFSRLLLELLDKIMEFTTSNEGVKLLNILYRLDFNGFYTEKLEAMSAERAAATLDTSAHSSESSSGSWPTSTFTMTRPENARYVPGKHLQHPPSTSGSIS